MNEIYGKIHAIINFFELSIHFLRTVFIMDLVVEK
jgi:hypothetical protein